MGQSELRSEVSDSCKRQRSAIDPGILDMDMTLRLNSELISQTVFCQFNSSGHRRG